MARKDKNAITAREEDDAVFDMKNKGPTRLGKNIPVDEYVRGEENLGIELQKYEHAAQMSHDTDAEVESRKAYADLDASEARVNFVLHGVKYMMAEGLLKSRLEQDYVVDDTCPEQVKTRILTYEQGQLGVSEAATLRVEVDSQGIPKRDASGKMMTIHGKLDQDTIDAAQSAMYMESVVQPNMDLIAELSQDYKGLIETAFESGRPLMFTPSQRKDITDLM